MAIAFDTSDFQNSGQNVSVSLAAAQTNEIAIMFIQYSSTSVSISSVTVNGSATGVVQVGGIFTGVTGQNMACYYFLNPSTSAVAYAASTTVNDDITIFIGIYSGVNQAAPDSNNSGFAAASSVTLSTTVVASNAWLVSSVKNTGAGSGTPTGGTGTTARQARVGQAFGDSNGTVGTGSQSMTWNNTGGNLYGGIIISLAPSGGAAVTIPTLTLLGAGV